MIRNLPSVETLGSATVTCTDKAGTLTLNRMEVRVLVGDPLEEALLRMAQISGGQVSMPLVDELPFSTERRMLSILHRSEQGLVLYSKGRRRPC